VVTDGRIFPGRSNHNPDAVYYLPMNGGKVRQPTILLVDDMADARAMLVRFL